MSSWWEAVLGKKKGPSYEELQEKIKDLESVVDQQQGENKDTRRRLLAYLAEEAAIRKKLGDALEFYADRDNWAWKLVTPADPAAVRDRGRRARRALGKD
jgi:hypothetical protein